MHKMTTYNIKSELGRGGMATVYLAHDQKFDTNVAIKVLNKEYVNSDNIRKRFIAEARSMFKMSHPNIIKVTDLIDEGDTVAFAMEYIEGETLKEYIDGKGRLKDDEIKTIFSQMLEAVGYVHEQNLVHRDIKPSNFMIDKKGKVKLMDFGIAKTLDASSSEYTQTGTSMQMGTPMYMSPEQITETKSVTAQSDIYSLGVVLWQMVTGQKPYDTRTLSSFQLQMKIVTESLEITGTKWDIVIQKATSKSAEERYKYCHELIGFQINHESESPASVHILNPPSHFDSSDLTTLETANVVSKEQPKSEEYDEIGFVQLNDFIGEARKFVEAYNYINEADEIKRIYIKYHINYSISSEAIAKFPMLPSQLNNIKNKRVDAILNSFDAADIRAFLETEGVI